MNAAASNMMITKRSGRKEPYVADKINHAVERACEGLDEIPSKVMKVFEDFELTLFDGITTREIDNSLVIAASQNIQVHPDYDTIAKNLLLLIIYKDVMEGLEPTDDIADKQKKYFPKYVKQAIKQKLLSKDLKEKFDLEKLASSLDLKRDKLFKYLGLSTLKDRYLVKDSDLKLIETPQVFWMRIAMGLSLNEKNPTETAIKIYDEMSQLKYIHSTPTLFNSGTNHNQLSSCYVINMYDSMENIGKTITDTLMLSKHAGGIGLSATNIRAVGSYIKGVNGVSSGVIPFLKILDTTIKGVSQGGKRRGSLCIYMENWHYEFDEFIELRTTSGDPYRRTHAANIAAWISDEYMKRVEKDQDWYMFDPAETPDLSELYGKEFSKRYNEYIKMAEKGQLKMYKKVKAKEMFKDMLMRMQTTSHPWITFKDSMNVRALTKNAGVIHSSNLCTEIALVNDEKEVAVCNLASINLTKFISKEKKTMNFDQMESTIRVAIRALDNVIDINLYPIPETKNSNDKNRPVGLGLMGFAQTLQELNISYGSTKADNLIDKIVEFISYIAIDESANIAQEKGSYKNFKGSGWSKGQVPIDTIKELESSRGVKLKVNKKTSLDWKSLRAKVKKGMRNSNVMAIAPTASIGLIAGASPSIDPYFANIFSRTTLSGKFMEFNPTLVKRLIDMGIWDEVKDQIVQNRGELANIAEIPEEMKEIFKTSFEINPEAYTNVAARAQKYVDQAISRNIYLEDRSLSNMMEVYINAWKKGLKSTYYLHMKPRHTAEQSTTKVNKRETLVKKTGFSGFKVLKAQADQENQQVEQEREQQKEFEYEQKESKIGSKSGSSNNSQIKMCPIDPSEREACESCQ